jgi:hypothetical protein
MLNLSSKRLAFFFFFLNVATVSGGPVEAKMMGGNSLELMAWAFNNYKLKMGQIPKTESTVNQI